MPIPFSKLRQQLLYLNSLIKKQNEVVSLPEKINLLDQESAVHYFLKSHPKIKKFISRLDDPDNHAVKSVIVIEQGPIVFRMPVDMVNAWKAFSELLGHLHLVEKFYDKIGGILGYHAKVLEFLCEQDKHNPPIRNKQFHQPIGVDLSEQTHKIHEFIIEGLKCLPQMTEIYPIGGSGDRLDLHDSESGNPLPTAKLQFNGTTLLTGLINDIQAREYLYYKLFNEQCVTPIAMMTSHAKNNHKFVLEICETNAWFNRKKSSFIFFNQPGVPVITEEGNWVLKDPFKLLLKPGGHGVLWKLAHDEGIFNWFKEKKRSIALVRQINNPLANTDHGLIAFAGVGSSQQKSFGFASCHRLLHASEGVNILTEQKENNIYSYGISNIEYTDFSKYNIQDSPTVPKSPYSIFPSNTNILYADLQAVESVIKESGIPGLLINMKKKFPFIDAAGKTSEVFAGRLESTMQNIADVFVDTFDHPIFHEDVHLLKTFLTFNKRRKTISVTKNAYSPGKGLMETPEACFYDYLKNAYDLLHRYCKMDIPKLEGLDNYIKHGPPFLFTYHPSLGPLFSIISQKIKGGSFIKYSELQLKIAELNLQDLHLDGSLTITATDCMGSKDSENILTYSEKSGKCTLLNCQVSNDGIDYSKNLLFWKHELSHREQMTIKLDGNAEFYAENIHFKGNHFIEVPENHRIVAAEKDGSIRFEIETLKKPSWHWKYNINNKFKIALEISNK